MDHAAAQQDPMNMTPDPRPSPVGTAQSNVDPRLAYDGTMFLSDRPAYFDPSKVQIHEPVRYFSDQGLITITDRTAIPLQPNYFYNPTMPIVFK